MKPFVMAAALLVVLAVPCFGSSFNVDDRRSTGDSATTWFTCQPTEVMEFENRIHVRCANAQGLGRDQVTFLAVDKRDKDRANRFASMATAAVLGGKTFRVAIPVGPAGNAPGCQPSDCRTPVAFGVIR